MAAGVGGTERGLDARMGPRRARRGIASGIRSLGREVFREGIGNTCVRESRCEDGRGYSARHDGDIRASIWVELWGGAAGAGSGPPNTDANL